MNIPPALHHDLGISSSMAHKQMTANYMLPSNSKVPLKAKNKSLLIDFKVASGKSIVVHLNLFGTLIVGKTHFFKGEEGGYYTFQ